ncbi:DUF1564 family protein, partial [Leptospira gomenensis]
MGYLLLNNEEEISSRLQNDRKETVTLLVPEETWLRYRERYGEAAARRLPKKIPELLRTYAKFLTATKRLGKKAGTTLYQPSASAVAAAAARRTSFGSEAPEEGAKDAPPNNDQATIDSADDVSPELRALLRTERNGLWGEQNWNLPEEQDLPEDQNSLENLDSAGEQNLSRKQDSSEDQDPAKGQESISSSESGGAAGTRAAGQRSAEKKTMR